MLTFWIPELEQEMLNWDGERGINTKQLRVQIKKKNPNPLLRIQTRQLIAANKLAEYFLKRENKFVAN